MHFSNFQFQLRQSSLHRCRLVAQATTTALTTGHAATESASTRAGTRGPALPTPSVGSSDIRPSAPVPTDSSDHQKPDASSVSQTNRSFLSPFQPSISLLAIWKCHLNIIWFCFGQLLVRLTPDIRTANSDPASEIAWFLLFFSWFRSQYLIKCHSSAGNMQSVNIIYWEHCSPLQNCLWYDQNKRYSLESTQSSCMVCL